MLTVTCSISAQSAFIAFCQTCLTLATFWRPHPLCSRRRSWPLENVRMNSWWPLDSSYFCLMVKATGHHGRSRHFRSEGDKLFRDLLSDSSSSHIQLHLSLVAKEPHNHKQHSTRGPTSGLYNYILSNLKLKSKITFKTGETHSDSLKYYCQILFLLCYPSVQNERRLTHLQFHTPDFFPHNR